MKSWQGDCAPCARHKVRNRPEVKEAYRLNGKNYAERFGSSFLNSHRKEWKKKERPPDFTAKFAFSGPEQHLRNSSAALQWKRQVKLNSNYSCQCCNLSTRKLEADHILPFSLFPEYRLDINNGRALCSDCHKKYGARVINGNMYRAAYTPI